MKGSFVYLLYHLYIYLSIVPLGRHRSEDEKHPIGCPMGWVGLGFKNRGIRGNGGFGLLFLDHTDKETRKVKGEVKTSNTHNEA